MSIRSSWIIFPSIFCGEKINGFTYFVHDDAGEEDGPIEIAKLSHPSGIAVRGSFNRIAEDRLEYQGAVREFSNNLERHSILYGTNFEKKYC